jgi:hypothetical protein
MCRAASGCNIDACLRDLARTGTASQRGGTVCTKPFPPPSRMVDYLGGLSSADSRVLALRPLPHPASGCSEMLRKGLPRACNRPSSPLRKESP